MQVLVTGGAGFIGSHLVDLLVERGDEVTIFDNMERGRVEFFAHHGENVQFVGDLLDLDAVKAAMDGIDLVFHLAANPDIRLGTRVTDTDFEQGTIATYNVLESMRCADVNNIAFASSSVVYGEASEMPTPETYGPLFPISLYGASKLGSEALITSWVGTFGLKNLVVPICQYRRGEGTHGVIFDFIHKLKADPTRLEVLGNGRQEKSYMEVIDCARAMVHLTESTNDQVNCFNLGTHDTCSVRRIAEIVVEETGFENVSIEIHWRRSWLGKEMCPKPCSTPLLYSIRVSPQIMTRKGP